MSDVRRSFLTAEWRWLVMLTFEVDPRALTPLIPAGTVLDLLDGRALMSVVGFRFVSTRLIGLAIPGHRDFDEVNLRFYVRREDPRHDPRRGVVFVREIVPRRAIAIVARLGYNEPYVSLPMRSSTPAPGASVPGQIEYAWKAAGGWNRITASAAGAPSVAGPGDPAAFVTERYWGYTRQRNGRTIEYEVLHPRWRLWHADEATLDLGGGTLYGGELDAALSAPPWLALIADGSAVSVSAPRRLI